MRLSQVIDRLERSVYNSPHAPSASLRFTVYASRGWREMWRLVKHLEATERVKEIIQIAKEINPDLEGRLELHGQEIVIR